MFEKILDAAEEMVQCRGLDNVSFQEIADVVGLRKPSLFHHVKNKEELTLHLIDRCSNKHGPLYAKVIEKDIAAPKKLKELSKIFAEALTSKKPCLLAAIGRSAHTLSPASQKRLAEATQEAITRFASVFTQGRKEKSLRFMGKPEQAAMSFLGMLQGLQTLCQMKNAKGDLTNAEEFTQSTRTYIDALIAPK